MVDAMLAAARGLPAVRTATISMPAQYLPYFFIAFDIAQTLSILQ